MNPERVFGDWEREPRRLLMAIYQAALRAVDGRAVVARALAQRPLRGDVWLTAIGKAAESMTLGALDHLGGPCVGGLLIGRYPPANPPGLAALGIRTLLGGHPLPTQGSLDAGEALLAHLNAAPPSATLLFLISGGASSLVEVPVDGMGLADLGRANSWLLASGLPIDAINTVRTALSRIKGGGLLGVLSAWPTRPTRPLRALAISDVPGDDPAVIGSGLLVPAVGLAGRLGSLDLPPWLRSWTALGLSLRPPRSLAQGEGPPIEVVATLAMAKQAAADAALALRLPVLVHPEVLQGDAAEQGRALARALAAGPSGVQIWGGETTVSLPQTPGLGGRNRHLALAAALELAGRSDCLLLAAGTDGCDGNGEDAGALVDGGTVGRGALDGFQALDCLQRADSGTFLAASGDLLHTGPTGTNVMDLAIGLRLAPAGGT